ncbi:unnamed protein product [Paramecium octaurelia]|uniref:U6 snRNA phosphodiesterase 1 n=1 Tax=Paramecium octaurelia TaxID=43137 RepID=A0A8S1WX47_PAROT|nr:unnamed protein product [Paramecium octaurelia]
MSKLVDYSDDEEENAVRIVNRSHMSGFYPSFCKIDVTSQFPKLKQEEYHISLSLNFQLNYHQIKDFIDSIQNDIDTFQAFTCTLNHESKIYKNEITKKEYLVLEVNINKERVKQLINLIAQSITLFDKLYQRVEIIPHCTIKQHLNLKNQITLKVNTIDIVIGKQITKIPLKQ